MNEQQSFPSRKLTMATFRLLTLFFIVLNLSSRVTTISDDLPGLGDLESFIETTLQCRQVPGAVVTIVRKGAVIYEDAFGKSSLNTDESSKTTVNTFFPIGSVTKGFTATVLAQVLAESNGSVTWDTPIRNVLGDSFPFRDKLWTNEVTLRDLLAHKMGYPANFGALLVGFSENTTLEDMTRIVSHMEPVAPFRTKFLYNNYMYAVAGYIAEKITGESWENLVMKYIFTPLKMTHSGFVDIVNDFTNFSLPFVSVDGKQKTVNIELLRAVKGCGPAGSIYSTVRDMSKWIQFHLNRGSVDGKQIVNGEFLDETYKEEFVLPPDPKNLRRPQFPVDDINYSYGMGWVQSIYRGYRKVSHSGGIVTYTTLLWLLPDVDAGIFIALNGPQDGQAGLVMDSIARRATDSILNLDPWLNASTSCSFPEPWKEGTPPERHKDYAHDKTGHYSIPIREFTGLYRHSAFGDILVARGENGSDLSLTFGRFGHLSLYREAELEFVAVFVKDLWYMTGSDGTTNKWPVMFNQTNNVITYILYPIDHEYNSNYFKKVCDSSQSNNVADNETGQCPSRGIPLHRRYRFLIFMTLIFTNIFIQKDYR